LVFIEIVQCVYTVFALAVSSLFNTSQNRMATFMVRNVVNLANIVQ